MEKTIVYTLTPEVMNDMVKNLAEREVKYFADRFYGVIVKSSFVAQMHGVSSNTVVNYANRGMIPHTKEKSTGNLLFRLSDVLLLNFDQLREQL